MISTEENASEIREGRGMTVLIQQLTATSDVELSKTIKYLLHLCVPQGCNILTFYYSQLRFYAGYGMYNSGVAKKQ